MEQARLFEYKEHWLVRRPDTHRLYIAWWPGGSACRRIRRKATGTADIGVARQRLIEFVSGGEVKSGSPRGDDGQARDGATQRQTHQPPAKSRANRSRLVSSVVRSGTTRAESGVGGGGPEPVLIDLLCDYIERLRNRPSYRTAVPTLAVWTEFLAAMDVVHVSEFTLEAQERFVAWRRERIRAFNMPGSNSTLIRELGVVKAALRDAWKRGKLAAVPYVLSLPSPPPRDRFLSVEEVQRLLAQCHQPHLRLYVMLALHTLQRPAAILDLRVSQVDLSSNRIDFLPPGRVQSKKRRPVVPISATLRPTLERAVRESLSGHIVEWNGKPVTKIRTTFQKACRRAGLVGVSPYVLRHTGPTLLAAAGVPLRQIGGLLGHSSDRTTELYAKHRPEFLLEATHKLDELFGAASGTAGGSNEAIPEARR